MTRRILRTVAYVVVGIICDLLEAAAYFTAVVLTAFLLSLLLPLPVAIVIALLGVSIAFGYRRARQIERARMRGEIR